MKFSNLAELSQPGSGAAGMQAKSGTMVTLSEPGGEGLGAATPHPQAPALLSPHSSVGPTSWRVRICPTVHFPMWPASTLASLGNASSLTDFNYEQRANL